MRLAFNILPIIGNMRCIELFDAAMCSDKKPEKLGTIIFSKERTKTFIFENLMIGDGRCIKSEDAATIRKVAKAFDGDEASKQFTPLVIARSLVADRGVQVVYDPTLRKFRCCSTMQEGADTYELVGTNINVSAKDEDHAVRLGKKEITSRMEEKPEEADKLVKFFTGGCKVKKLVSGKLPEFIKITELAQAGEEKIAASPIKVGNKEDKDD